MIFLFVALISFLIGWSIPLLLSTTGKRRWKKEAKLLLEQAQIERQRFVQETDLLINEKKKQLMTESEERHIDFIKRERNLDEREQRIKRKETSLEEMSLRLEEKRKKADQRIEGQTQLQIKLDRELLEKASLTKEEALRLSLEKIAESQKESFHAYKNEISHELIEEERRNIARAFEDVLQSGYSLLSSHSHIHSLSLPTDSTIPRLIGKEGRNIEGLRTLLDCDLWVNDEKNELVLLSYDDMKRFIALSVMQELIAKDLYTLSLAAQVKEHILPSLDKEFMKKGQEAVQEASLSTYLPEGVLIHIGKLHLRSSLGQNVLLHSIETAKMAKALAMKLQLNPERAGIMGLLHDIGKVVEPSLPDRHPARGAMFLEHQGMKRKLCESVAHHHQKTGHSSSESLLIPYVDALSAKSCAKRLFSQNMPFKKLQSLIEEMPQVISATVVDLQTKLLLLIKTKEAVLIQDQLESMLRNEKVAIPVDVELFSSQGQMKETLTLLPQKI